MHYDALVASAIAQEWRQLLLGGRIDRIFQPDAWSLALLVRSLGQNRQVLFALNPRFARAVLIGDRKLNSGFDEPSPFVMLLRKHLEGARIGAIEQPPLERILHVQTSHGGAPPSTLIVELLGRQSNAVLLDEQGSVLGVLRSVTAEMSRTRVILPHREYTPPPAAVGGEGSRLDPRTVTDEALGEALARLPAGPLTDLLPRVLALSPTAAREAVFRAGGDARAAGGDAHALAAALRELTAPCDAPTAWTPTAALRAGALVAFAPYRLHHLAGSATVEAASSMSLAVERYFTPKEAQDKLEGRRGRLRALVRAALERAERRAASFESQLAQAREHLALRHAGELLLAYQPETAGQREVTLDDYETGAPARIVVDPNKDAVQNAQELFRHYGRAKRALDALAPQQADAALDVAFGRQLLSDVALCETPGDLIGLEEEIRASGYVGERGRQAPKWATKAKGQRKGERVPAASVSAPTAIHLGGFEVLYGRTSQINDALTFRLAARQDLWLHAKGVPGAHVVLRSGGRTVPDAVLADAASLAAYLSEARGEARAAVDYTTVANVRRQPGGKPGLVYYVGERTIQAVPRAPEDVVEAREGRMLDSCALALKEWAVAVFACASGQTICAVRKGGIHEKRFDVPGRTCLLFPTYLHQAPETVQPRFRAALEQVLANRPADGMLHLRYSAEITDVVPLDAPARLDGLAPHVIWTPTYVEQRFRWRPRHPLQLLLLRVHQLPADNALPLAPAYGGCSSWVTLDEALPLAGAVPVLDDARYAAERAAVLEAVRVVVAS